MLPSPISTLETSLPLKVKRLCFVSQTHSWRLCNSPWSPVKFKAGQNVLGNLLQIVYMCHCHPFLNIHHQEANSVFMTALPLCFASRGEQTVQTDKKHYSAIKPSISRLGFQVAELLPRPCKLSFTNSIHPKSPSLHQQPPLTSSPGSRFKQYPCSGWSMHPMCQANWFI